MYQRLLLILAFSLSAIFATAQDKGLYLGVQANGGFSDDANCVSVYSAIKSHGEVGFTGTFMVKDFWGVTAGGLYNKFRLELCDSKVAIGLQRLDYWRVPIGVRFLFPQGPNRVKIDFYGGLSLYFLQDASYVNGYAYGGNTKPTVADYTTQNYRSVGLGGYTGMGMNIRIGKPSCLTLGFQIGGTFNNQNKSGNIQGHHMEADLFAFTFNLGFQTCIFSYGKKGFWSGR